MNSSPPDCENVRMRLVRRATGWRLHNRLAVKHAVLCTVQDLENIHAEHTQEFVTTHPLDAVGVPRTRFALFYVVFWGFASNSDSIQNVFRLVWKIEGVCNTDYDRI